MTLKIGANILPNINPDSGKNSSVNISNQTLTNSEKINNAALLHLTNRLTNDDIKTPTVGDFLDEVLAGQPLETGKKEKRVNLDVKYPKPPEDMTVEDYKQALIRAEYKQAGLGMLTDEEIKMSEAALAAKGFSVKYYDFNLESLRRDHQTDKPLFTTDFMIERAQRGGQAVLQYQQSKAERADELKAKAENETNQMFLDQARVLWNSGVNIVEGTINTGLDAAASNGGRNPLVLIDPTRPQVDFSGAKMDYQSEMMRRDINGKVDGDGIKRGDFTEAGVTILAPFVVGAVTTPKSAPQSLKTLGGIPEVETTTAAVSNASKTITKVGKLEVESGRTLSKSEQRFADKMVAEGKVVKAKKEVNQQNVKNPDFEIDNEIVEFKNISDLKGTDVDTLSGGLSRRILDGGSQASKVTLDATEQTGMTKEIAERAVKRAFGSLRKRNSDAINEVRIYGKDFDIAVKYEK